MIVGFCNFCKGMTYCFYSAFFLIILSISLGFSNSSRASHATGGELVYEHISGSTYKFVLKFYRDCGGVAEPPDVELCYFNTCGPDQFTTTMSKIDTLPGGFPNGSPTYNGCAQYPTTCSGGTLAGYTEWWYTVEVTLPYACNSWLFAVSINGRNPNTNIIPGQSMYLSASLNNMDAPTNSSAFLTVKPVAYICINQPYSFNNGATDIDGDSLSIELIQPLAAVTPQVCPYSSFPIPFLTVYGANQINYNPTNNPIATNNTFQLNGVSGQMSFTPNLLQRSTVAFLVKEFRNGILVGSIIRDVQFIVLPCINVPPELALDTSNIVNGDYKQGVVNVCAGESLSFCFKITSASDSAVLSISDNSASVLSGASVIYSNMFSDTVTGCVNWMIDSAASGIYVLTISAKDSICTPPGLLIPYVFSIPINVINVETSIMGDSLICKGSSTILQADGGYDFTWAVLTGDKNSLGCTTCPSTVVTPNIPTTYTVESYLGCSSDTFTVSLYEGPPIDLGPDIVKCKQDSVQLILNLNGLDSSTYTFLWNPSDFLSSPVMQLPFTWTPSEIEYSVKASPISGGCPSYDTINVVIATSPSFETDTAICFGEELAFTNTSTGTVSTGWLWDFGDGLTSTENSPVHKYAAPGKYTVYLVAYPCEDTAIKVVMVDSTPFVRFITDIGQVCEGRGINFYPQFRSGAENLQWDFGDGTGKINSWQPVHAFDSSGTYQVTVVASYPSCPDSNTTQTINVHPHPVVSLGPDTSLCPGGDAILLYNRAEEQQSYVYKWNTGAETKQILTRHPGVYSLTARSEQGCTTTDSMEIFKGCYINIPNVFTPNGDGINDFFFPRSLLSRNVTRFKMEIYNRWGQLIFETKSTSGRGWDGRFNNAEQPQGVFIYLLEAEIDGKHLERYTGNVTLIR